MSRCSRCTSNVKIINRFGDFDRVWSPSIPRGSTKTRKAFWVAWISYECTRNTTIAVPLVEEWFTCIWYPSLTFHFIILLVPSAKQLCRPSPSPPIQHWMQFNQNQDSHKPRSQFKSFNMHHCETTSTPLEKMFSGLKTIPYWTFESTTRLAPKIFNNYSPKWRWIAVD